MHSSIWRKLSGDDGQMGIRTLVMDDLAFAAGLTADEGWFYTPRELHVMLKLDPEGSFVYEEDEPLGFVTTVTYGKTGVLGHLVVSKKGRGRKIGESLLAAAMKYMMDRGTESQLLYATREAVRLYQRHGFSPGLETYCAHLHLEDHKKYGVSPDCLPLRRNDLDEVARIDKGFFGDDRSKLIHAIFDEGPKHAFKMERNGRIAGFVLARHDHNGYDLGPWVCLTGNPNDAEALFDAVLSTLDDDSTIYMGSFFKNEDAVGIIDRNTKIRSWRIPLMVRGKVRYGGDLSRFYGITAFELG
jgi:GNAT superfamily N-acetyltransferase